MTADEAGPSLWVAGQVNVGQRQWRECTCGFLGQTTVAHFAKTP